VASRFRPPIKVAVPLLLALGTLLACGDGGWGSSSLDVLLVPPADTETATDTETGATTCGQGPGNELGVGKPCTKGGKQCPQGLNCDADLDPKGVGVCIKLLCKADGDCGSGATCCTPSGSPMKVCIIGECLPPECGGPPAGNGD